MNDHVYREITDEMQRKRDRREVNTDYEQQGQICQHRHLCFQLALHLLSWLQAGKFHLTKTRCKEAAELLQHWQLYMLEDSAGPCRLQVLPGELTNI